MARIRPFVVLLILLSTVSASSIPAGAQSPSISLDPAVATPGDAVVVTGSGFEGGTGVTIFLDAIGGTRLATTTSDRNGGFTVRFTTPRAAGPHVVIACLGYLAADNACRQAVRARFEIESTPEPTSPPPTDPPPPTHLAPNRRPPTRRPAAHRLRRPA